MKQLKGIISSSKMDKTAVVVVEKLWQHPLYKKKLKRNKKYLVHNELGAKDEDMVIFQACRPISKRKKFKIIKVIK
jgi:small subunit ribosomal protein S17